MAGWVCAEDAPDQHTSSPDANQPPARAGLPPTDPAEPIRETQGAYAQRQETNRQQSAEGAVHVVAHRHLKRIEGWLQDVQHHDGQGKCRDARDRHATSHPPVSHSHHLPVSALHRG